MEDRKIRALEGIKSYLGDLVKVMDAVNKNLVEFAKQIQESDERYDKIMTDKGDMMALVPRSYVAPEGYAAGAPEIKKAGE